MGLFNQSPSPTEEALYKQVLDEVDSGVMRKGIYAKALADSSGDGGKAQSLYIKYRVQSLIDNEKNDIKIQKLEKKKAVQDEKDRIEYERSQTHWGKYQEWYSLLIGGAVFFGFIILVLPNL